MSKTEVPWASQVLRDIDWLIDSPSLISQPNSLQQTFQRKRSGLSVDLIREHFTEPPPHRVGQYSERLVHFWLTHVMNFQVVQRNYQVKDGKRTRGELDFIFRTTDGELIHWELAVKFYLFCGHTTCHDSHYIGPNTNDTFERKIDRLLKQQLPLGAEVFSELDRSEPFVKGRIFYHPNESNPPKAPSTLATDHLRGTWLRTDELDPYLLANKERTFRFLKKPFWLSRAISPDWENRYSGASLKENLAKHFEQSPHSLLVAVFPDSKGASVECERLFIVGSQWPKTAIPA